MFRSVRPSYVRGVLRYHNSIKPRIAAANQASRTFSSTKILHKMADLSTSPIKDYTSFLSVRNLRRKPSAIRELQPLFSLPGMISLGGGMPNPTLFPFEKMQLTLKNGQTLDVDGSDLAEALQYSSSYGLPALVNILKNLQERHHKLTAGNVPAWDICVTTGSQDAFEKTFDLLLNEEDYIITESPTYSGTISALYPYNINVVTVDCDAHGMKTDQLKKILEAWNWSEKKLKFIYTIPTGQNPSGCSMTLERKKDLYRLASRYNVLILEDDPYYFLQLPTTKNPVVDPVPSLLSMDTDGRVLRFDSLSKVISAGMRVGWVTGPKHLVERIQIAQQAMVLHSSGLSQAAVIALLKSWGEAGWDKQILTVQKLYAERRDMLLKCAEKHLAGLAEWFEPSAGMFVWFKLLGIEDSHELIKTKAVNEKVIMVPGSAFSVDKKPSPYVRASYSIATPEQMDEALKRLATLLKKERGIPTD